jgi:hypothetical protein
VERLADIVGAVDSQRRRPTRVGELGGLYRDAIPELRGLSDQGRTLRQIPPGAALWSELSANRLFGADPQLGSCVDAATDSPISDQRPADSTIPRLVAESVKETGRDATRRAGTGPSRASSPADQISLEWTMCSNWRHRSTTRSAEPAKANQNGAVIPNVFARRPPIGVPITIPPMIATR